MTIHLPWPPSMNMLWRTVKGRVLLSSEGREYYARAREVITPQVRGCIDGPVSVMLAFYPPDKRRRDLDNLLKATLDAGTKGGIWKDDSQVVEIAARKLGVLPGGRVVMEVNEIGGDDE